MPDNLMPDNPKVARTHHCGPNMRADLDGAIEAYPARGEFRKGREVVPISEIDSWYLCSPIGDSGYEIAYCPFCGEKLPKCEGSN